MEATDLAAPSRPIEQTEEFRQFKDFARRIVAVPKAEVDARLAESATVKKPRKAKPATPQPSPKTV